MANTKESLIYIPFSKELYDDVIRFSDGRLSVEHIVEHTVETFISNSIQFGDDYWEGRWEEAAEKYAPQAYQRWLDADQEAISKNKPLIWKEVVIKSGSEVRMHYNGEDHYAKIISGKIVDNDEMFTPSEWASKIANGTNRNAWKDLWFKEPLSEKWQPAQLMRDRAKQGD